MSGDTLLTHRESEEARKLTPVLLAQPVLTENADDFIDEAPADSEVEGTVPAHKARSAFRTISEVSSEMGVPQHVLRFWESKFTQIRPLKRAGGRRYYRLEDIRLLKMIQHLLYKQGFTIRGVQKLLRENRGDKFFHAFRKLAPDSPLLTDVPVVMPTDMPAPQALAAARSQPQPNPWREDCRSLLKELQEIRALLVET